MDWNKFIKSFEDTDEQEALEQSTALANSLAEMEAANLKANEKLEKLCGFVAHNLSAVRMLREIRTQVWGIGKVETVFEFGRLGICLTFRYLEYTSSRGSPGEAFSSAAHVNETSVNLCILIYVYPKVVGKFQMVTFEIACGGSKVRGELSRCDWTRYRNWLMAQLANELKGTRGNNYRKLVKDSHSYVRQMLSEDVDLKEKGVDRGRIKRRMNELESEYL